MFTKLFAAVDRVLCQYMPPEAAQCAVVVLLMLAAYKVCKWSGIKKPGMWACIALGGFLLGKEVLGHG